MSTVDMFNAVGIEYAVGRLLLDYDGKRGTIYDADVFREGDPADLAEVLRQVADAIEKRVAFLKFPSEAEGGSKAQVVGCVHGLKRLAEKLQRKRKLEHEDYHWEVIGELILAIAGLLETLEAQATVQ